MSKRRCCEKVEAVVAPVSPCGVGSLCTNPLCALIVLIILQKTCLLENNNAFLLILLFLGFCFCSGRRGVGPIGAY